MRILIIESGLGSAEKLKGSISAVKKECNFLPFASSIQESLEIVSTITPDVIFMNIDLSESKGFDLLRKTTFMSPIVFTTDDHEAATAVIHKNDVIYILNTYQQKRIEEAFYYIEKTKKLRDLPVISLAQADAPERAIKNRFLFRHGQKLIPVKSAEINHFSSEGSLVHVVTRDKRRYVADESLNELDEMLNPAEFFRINRKFIIAKDSILSLDYYSKGQVAVKANLLETERLVVSRQQTPVLKMWLSQ